MCGGASLTQTNVQKRPVFLNLSNAFTQVYTLQTDDNVIPAADANTINAIKTAGYKQFQYKKQNKYYDTPYFYQPSEKTAKKSVIIIDGTQYKSSDSNNTDEVKKSLAGGTQIAYCAPGYYGNPCCNCDDQTRPKYQIGVKGVCSNVVTVTPDKLKDQCKPCGFVKFDDVIVQLSSGMSGKGRIECRIPSGSIFYNISSSAWKTFTYIGDGIKYCELYHKRNNLDDTNDDCGTVPTEEEIKALAATENTQTDNTGTENTQ